MSEDCENGIRRKVIAASPLAKHTDRIVLGLECGHTKLAHVVQLKKRLPRKVEKVEDTMASIQTPSSVVCFQCSEPMPA